MSDSNIQKEVDENYKAFKELLPELLKDHWWRFALMHNKEVVHIFDSVHDAVVFAKDKYEDELFSVQEVTEQSANLDYFSHAINLVLV